MNPYYALRCWLGRPATYRAYQGDGDWWFAKCRHCNRQAEVHDRYEGRRRMP